VRALIDAPKRAGVQRAVGTTPDRDLSTSRRNQWALDALGKQPVAHSPPPCSAGYLGRSRTDWIGYALVFWNRALPRRPLMTLASHPSLCLDAPLAE
jgi:hypothetical protein